MGRALIIGLLLLLLTACGGAGTAESDAVIDTAADGAAEAPAAEPAPAAGEAGAAVPEAEGDTEAVAYETDSIQTRQNLQPQQDRLVIRTATLELTVARVDEAEAQVRRLAERMGGFVLSSQTYGEDNQRFADITIKVPADRFDVAIGELVDLALVVDKQKVDGQDVTDEFVDLESRLRNLRAVEARLLEFLQEAENVEDALRVNGQLTEIQGQIEQTQGRINYLRQSAAMSTINVSLRAQAVVAVTPDPGWSPVATARLALRSLLEFGQSVASVVIVLAVWTPVWLPVLLVGVWLWRRAHPVPVRATQEKADA